MNDNDDNFELLKRGIEDSSEPLTVLHYSFDIAVYDEDTSKAISTMVEADSKTEDMLAKAGVRYRGFRSFTSYSNEATKKGNISNTLMEFRNGRRKR